MNKPTNIEANLAGNSPASRDIAFHMHPYTNPAQLASAAPVIAGRAFDFAVVSRDRRNQPMR